ncbi:hypothetical protein CR513_36221, partial [Mucuna pruriens]
MVVDKQGSLAISIGKYKDEILCYVVPMEVTCILLGMVSNRFSFEHMGQKIVLKSLSPREHIFLIGLLIRKIQKSPKKSKKQVSKLIEKGWVRESTSPCVILVIVVPKKDDTWRMYMDYRPINVIMTSHPPTRWFIDGLHGSIVFSKIDL